MNFSKTIGVQQGSFLFQVLLSISFCFLGALTQTAPGNPIITGPTNAVEGQSVSLNCTTTGGSSPVTVRWQRNTVLVDGTIDGSFTNSLGIAVNYNTYSFTVSRTDNLVSYICLVHNAALSSNLTREWTISVYVQASAPVINGPTTTLDSGNTYTYTCTAASGRPAPEIEWKLGSTLSSATTLGTGTYDPLVTNSDSTFTRISTLSWVPIVGDNGKSLFCIASQSATVPSQNTFRVISVQQIPIIRSAQSAYSTQAGQSVVLRCNVTSAFPAITSAYWQKRGNSGFQTVTTDSRITQASFSTNNPDLTITNAQVSDAGEYRCFATNQAGTGSSGIITLSVTGNPPSITILRSVYQVSFTSDVTLVCIVTSSLQLVTFTWRKYSGSTPVNLVVSGNSHYSGGTRASTNLTVHGATFTDEAYYDCQATNAAGTSTSSQIFLDVVGNVPNVTIPQAFYQVTAGGTVTIQCNVSSNPFQISVEWQRINSGVSTAINVTAEARYSGGNVNTPSLTITNAVSGDAGIYVCSASNNYGKGVSGQTNLTVLGNKPTINIGQQSSYNILIGNPVTLTCIPSGTPTVFNVFWTRTRSGSTTNVVAGNTGYGSVFSNGNVNSPSLTLTNAQQADSGTYTCKAQNAAGTTDSSPIFLTVSGTQPSVSIPQNSYSVITTQNATITCAVSAIPTANSIWWTFIPSSGIQTNITTSTSKYTLTGISGTSSTLFIRNTASSDSGTYRCTATNSVGQGSDSATLSVSGSVPALAFTQSSYNVLYGTNAFLQCSISANPTAQIATWFFVTRQLTIQTSSSKYTVTTNSIYTTTSLTVINTDSSDEGTYICRAGNQVGSGSASANLTITGSAPSVNIPQSSYSTVIGTSILIPCSVSATPDVTGFRWTFQPSTGGSVTIAQSGGRYQLSTNWQSPSLRVVNTTFGDTGTYTCQSTNIVGTVSDSTALTITGTVPNVTLSQASYSVLKGQNITLDCQVTGGSPPEITAIKWRYRATVSSSPNTLNVNSNQNKYVGSTVANPNLTIINVVDGDQGLYACIASNLYGDGESDQVLLDVTGSAPTVVVSPPSLSVTQTQNVTITCSVTGADPAIREVRWEKHSSGGQVTQITIGGRFSGATFSNPSLTISFVEPSDTGIYYCTAENLVASTKSTTECSLTVTGSAPSSVSITRGGSLVTTTTVNVGSSITLTCAASGSPAPTFSWRFGGAQVATGSSYTINSVAKNQDGVYTCRATNLLSSADGTVTMDVQYAPEDVRTAAQTDVTGSVGGTVQLSCNVDADPTPSYRWYRNNVLISTVTTKDYSVLINTNDDFGSYSCTAQNSLGTANLAFTISNAGTGNTGASTVSSGLSTGEIAAIVLALLLLLLLIIIIIICCITHGVCGAICGKKDTKGRVEPVEKEVYKETSKEVIIPRFHEESIKGKREPSAISRKDVDVRVHQNGHFRKENDYEIVRYETVPATSTHVITESPRAPRRLPKLEYTYEDVAEKKRKRRKKRHHKRRHGAEEVVVERVIRSRSASPTRVYRTETEEPVVVERIIRSSSPTRIVHQESEEPVIVETVRTSSRSPSRRRRVKEDEEMIIERSSRSPSTRRRHEENFMTQETIGNGDIIHGEGDLRAYNGVVYREAPSRHSSGRYYVEGGSMRRSHSGRRDYGSDDEVEVVYGKEYVVEH